MEWYMAVLIVAVGFAAGFINTLAGSGSLLTLPMLMFMGLPANVANGTNRIAILLQNVVGVSSFKQQKVFTFREGIWLTIPAVIGSIVGANLAINIDEKMMGQAIGALLVIMFFLILFKPEKWVKMQAGKVDGKPNLANVVIFFFIGMYGGFIQAGVGFAGLVLGAGFDLIKANAIKLFIVLVYTFFALGIFIYNDQVDWKFGLILAVGNMLGAFVASRFAVNWGTKYIRIILLVAIAASGIKLLFGF